MSAVANDDLAWPSDAVEVGRVLDAWGVKGWIKVLPYSADPQALFSSRRWFIEPPQGPRPAARPMPRSLRITAVREHGDAVVAQARELPDRNAAEVLKGARIFVSRASFPTAGEGEYYWVDLIGLAVVNRQGQTLGRVVDLMDTGAHSILRVVDDSTDAPTERLIPFVAVYVDQVDTAAGRILVDWGLDY
ncbi:ribosome maturation factor RimM [Caldimonas taiwanensis]|uniref:ribosome maturation factor RimM n=1 Tax=Caldimonas taiwanensis TaxID=307483 RepID=UPI000780D4ED|nr:ribosome maturation factor RimM [Caldimonas taiwanensis]